MRFHFRARKQIEPLPHTPGLMHIVGDVVTSCRSSKEAALGLRPAFGTRLGAWSLEPPTRTQAMERGGVSGVWNHRPVPNPWNRAIVPESGNNGPFPNPPTIPDPFPVRDESQPFAYGHTGRCTASSRVGSGSQSLHLAAQKKYLRNP